MTVINTEKCEGKDCNRSTLVRELETAKILQELSRNRTAGTSPKNDNRFDSRRGLVVSPTPSCDSFHKISKKRSIREVSPMHHGFNIPSNVEDTSNASKLSIPLFIDDEEASTSEMQEKKMQPRIVSSIGVFEKSSNFLNLGKAETRPLMPPPKMRHLHKFSNPDYTGNIINVTKKNNVRSSMYEPPVQKLPSSQPSTQLLISSPFFLMDLMTGGDQSLQDGVPLCRPVANPSQIQSKSIVKPDYTSSSAGIFNKKSSNDKKKRKVCRMDMCDAIAAKRTPYCAKHTGQRNASL